jgi:hypothetical protein
MFETQGAFSHLPPRRAVKRFLSGVARILFPPLARFLSVISRAMPP